MFGRVQLQKLTRRSTILEGENALYRVRLNGPPPSGFYLNLNNVDDFTRFVRMGCMKRQICSVACVGEGWLQLHPPSSHRVDQEVN